MFCEQIVFGLSFWSLHLIISSLSCTKLCAILSSDRSDNLFVFAHHVAVFTLRGAVPVIELHTLQGAMTAHATETVGMEEFIHGSDGWLRAGQSLATFPTHL